MSRVTHISPTDRRKVTEAITKAERSTSGEIMVVAAMQSDEYLHVPLHIATAVALAVPFLLPFAAVVFPWAAVSVWTTFAVQLTTFIIVALVLSLPALRYAVTPKRMMFKYAHRNAAAQFLAVNAHTTAGRSGILIFVSLLEHYCELVGDAAIGAKVKPAEWQAMVNEMLPVLRQGRTADALVLAVERAGGLLATHFPPGPTDSNELPDRFIVVGDRERSAP